MRPVLAAVLGCCITLLDGCGREEKACTLDPAVAKVSATVQLKRLEKSFFQIRTDADAKRFLAEHPLFATQFLQRRQFPSDDVLAATLTRLATNPGLQQLGRQTDSTFQDSEKLKGGLEGMFKHIRYYFPDFRVPPVQTFVSGLSQDMFVNDSLMVLGLDFFVGPKARYRPNVPEYILRRYRPEYMLPTAALAISSKYNKKELTNQTMLSEMVQYGKSLYFAERVLPCTPDSLLIGYTDKELVGVHFNEGKIWAHMLEKKLLYSTAPFTVQKYVGERPNIPEIDKTCPGRIGAWVGWQIVRKYMAEHPNVTLAQLMADKNPQHILNESRYRPRPRRAER
ncbi:gliding motility lipoprotein GldB [Hymenobacter psychrotolerans]|uniref:Gliding motility-associated lipoprotein GldB n=1 Tax=Hymenobacter psychrotolerans DSM 18569 TaxID=1121959 RepID=A0A1M6NWT1_9BACT|nr:gliding motility lipoprotein GldB [Hymenobacter psychrotolerans]SHK00197.1 gliding motility-associated lipoprotein GldB [Hymenobacter psychrotolerans DSM 18569]